MTRRIEILKQCRHLNPTLRQFQIFDQFELDSPISLQSNPNAICFLAKGSDLVLGPTPAIPIIRSVPRQQNSMESAIYLLATPAQNEVIGFTCILQSPFPPAVGKYRLVVMIDGHISKEKEIEIAEDQARPKYFAAEFAPAMLQPIAAVAARNNDAFTPLCTGFFFSEKPLLLTVAHSIPVAEQLVVMICDEVETYPLVNPTPRQLRITPAKLVDRDPRVDLALLEVQGATVTMKRERFLRGEDPPVGTSVAIGGFPFMPKLMVPVYRTGAICSKFTRTDLWGSTRMYMADVQCHQGDSGAPIVDLASNSVAGMVAGRFDPIESTGLGFGPSGPSIRGLPYNLAVVIRSNEICDFIKNSGAL